MSPDREYDVKAFEDGVRAGRHEAAAEIERLRAEVETWVNHTKTAVWSDSEECKMLAADNERLRAALHHIAWEQKEDDKPHLIARAALEEK